MIHSLRKSLVEEQNWEEKTNSAPTPMTEEERREFLSQAVLNVPNEESNLYEELICRHIYLRHLLENKSIPLCERD